MKCKIALKAAFLCLVFFPGGARSVFAEPFEETVRILEDSTSFHWGRDCLVWIVHYPEALVEPWVEDEAGRTGMTASERMAYRESFVSDLSIGKAEPFLFNVYAFGVRPISFAPLSENVSLITADGRRLKPLRYDRVWDRPVVGLVQGLVFFPKQENGEFSLAVRGMGVYDERLFTFSPDFSPGDTPFFEEEAKEAPVEVVVVELPPAPKASPKSSAKPKTVEAKPSPPAVPEIVVIDPALRTARPETPPEEEETESMAEFVEAMRQGRVHLPEEEKEDGAPANAAYVSREEAVRVFLNHWTDHRPEAMYEMLSASSRELFSKETFEVELRKASGFRAALKDGYKIDWLNTERAKIVAVRRLLLIRNLVSRTLGVVREDAAWKIVW